MGSAAHPPLAAALTLAGLVVAGLVTAGLVVAGLVVAGLVLAGEEPSPGVGGATPPTREPIPVRQAPGAPLHQAQDAPPRRLVAEVPVAPAVPPAQPAPPSLMRTDMPRVNMLLAPERLRRGVLPGSVDRDRLRRVAGRDAATPGVPLRADLRALLELPTGRQEPGVALQLPLRLELPPGSTVLLLSGECRWDTSVQSLGIRGTHPLHVERPAAGVLSWRLESLVGVTPDRLLSLEVRPWEPGAPPGLQTVLRHVRYVAAGGQIVDLVDVPVPLVLSPAGE
jgi:hypothetical protein